MNWTQTKNKKSTQDLNVSKSINETNLVTVN